MEQDSKKFGDRLRALIKQRELTLDQFASRYGIAESQLHNWLKREDPPLAKHWEKLATFFGVSRSYIIGAGATKNIEVGKESQGSYGTPETLRAEIRRLVESTISLAGDDVGKLGWFREQLIKHGSAPEHWDLLARVIEQNLKKRRAADEAAADEDDHSARDQGKAS